MTDMTAHDLLQKAVSLGLTQKQIESGTGINQPTISRLLNGTQADLPFSAGKRLEAFVERLIADHPAPEQEAE